MTAALERAAVGSLLGNWTATQIAWPNRDFTPPTKAAWLQVFIQAGDAAQIEFGSLGNATHRHPGIVVVQVFTPANWGDKTALELGDQVAALFRRQRSDFEDEDGKHGSIVFRSPAVRAIGVDGAYFQVNVSIPFVRDYLY
jgi:Bacteriophage related domain of unknown function